MRAISLALLATAWPDGAAETRRILDAGCGTGQQPRPLPPPRPRRWASTSRTRRCASAAAAAWPPPGAACWPCRSRTATFDAVTSFDVLYHRWVDDDRGGRARAGARAAPGRPAARARPGPEDAVGRPRRGRALAPPLHARRGAPPAARTPGSRWPALTYANTLLFPVLAARRTLDRLTDRHGSDVGFLPAPLEWTFRNLLRVEARLVRHVLPAHRGQRLRAGAQAARGRGGGPRLQSPACGAETHERPRAGRGRAAARARGVRDRARCTSAAATPARRPRRSRCPGPCRPTPARAASRPRRAPTTRPSTRLWRVRGRPGGGGWRRRLLRGLGRLLARRPRRPGVVQLAPGAVRQRAARLHRRPPRRAPTATTTRCWASTAATWARSTSAT